MRTGLAPVRISSSLESLDSSSYNMVNAMEILNLAEALDAAAETAQEQAPVLYDSEESDTEEFLGSEGTITMSILTENEETATTPISVESEETVSTSIPVENEETVTTLIPVENEETVTTLIPTEDVYTVVSENQQIALAQSSTSELEYQSVVERVPSRASASSSMSRIPRACQSVMSHSTNDSVIPPFRSSVSTITRYSNSATATGSLKERTLRSGAKSRLPIPFSNTYGVTHQHAHPQRLPASRTTLYSARFSTTTPDSLQSEVPSVQSDRNTVSQASSITCGFLRPTKSSEAKVSPKTPTKTDRQRTVMAFTASDKPLWK